MKLKSIVFVFFLLFTTSAFAQEEVLPVVRNTVISTGMYFQAWRLSHSKSPISQVSFPISIVIPVKPDMSISVTHTPSYSWWYTGSKLSGFSDTWIQGSYVFLNDKVMVDLGAGIPTGKVRLSNTEYELARHLSKRIYQYKVPVTGQGFCAKAGFAGAYDVSDNLVFGVGVSFIKKIAYHPVTYTYKYAISTSDTVTTNWAGEYKPGDELTINFGFDFKVSEQMKIMFDALYTRYGKDERDGREVFEAGNRVDLNLGFFWRISDDRYLWFRGIYRQSGKNELQQGLYFKEEGKNTNGPQAEFYLKYKIFPSRKGGVFINTETRFYGMNEEGWGGARVSGGGLTVQYNFTQTAKFVSNIKYLIGALRNLSDDSKTINSVSIEGFELGVGFEFEL
ncbi:hypothetical protein J7K93_01915 [bacterium]|nr:hypothetical protein [bacterium]